MSVAPNRLLSLSICLFFTEVMVSLWVILSIIHCILHQVCRLTFQLRNNWAWLVWSQFYAWEKKPYFLTHFWHATLLCCRFANWWQRKDDPYLLLECMSKLSFLYNYALFFCHALLVHKHLGKRRMKNWICINFMWPGHYIDCYWSGIILLFWLFLKVQTMSFCDGSSNCICNYLNIFFFYF